MTSNQLFHGLNDRFRKRTQFLYRLGFRYECADFRKTTEYDRVGGIAAMIRRHYTGPATRWAVLRIRKMWCSLAESPLSGVLYFTKLPPMGIHSFGPNGKLQNSFRSANIVNYGICCHPTLKIRP